MEAEKEKDFLEAIEKYNSSILRICRIYASSYMEPVDLFQDVIFNIWKSFSSFENKSNIGTWIYRIALNTCLRNKLKLDKHNSSQVPIDLFHFEKVGKKSDDEFDEERYMLLHDCIAKLNETNKSIALLYLEDLSYKQIAEIIGITENHVAVKMKRIRENLLKCLTKKNHHD